MNKNGFTVIEFIVICAIICIAFIVPAISMIGVHIKTGDGSQVGYISAVETNGWIFKTSRVYIKPDMSSTQEDQYCLVDKSAIKKLEELAAKKEKVLINYFSWMAPGIANCKGEPAIISDVVTMEK